MYIAPNTTIRLLNNVPLDSRYEDTISWNNVTDQTNYFIGKTKYTFGAESYQRVQKGKARVGRIADDLYDVNYMMFKNTSFGNKWFYAFVNHVEYINNSVAEIDFEIDVIQTWYFETNFRQCFIERTHTYSDRIGENTVQESISLGEYVHNTYFKMWDFTPDIVIISVVALDANGAGAYTSDVRLYDNTVSGSELYAFHADDFVGINKKLDSFKNAPDSVISMYMLSHYFLNLSYLPSGSDDYNVGDGVRLPSGTIGTRTGFYPGSKPVAGSTTIDGYVPRNNKLYTYPYHFFCVDNANGNTLMLPFEYFYDANGDVDFLPKFHCFTTITYPVQADLRPVNYKHSGDGESQNTESIKLDNFPMCSWNVDAYKAWLAQNAIPMTLNAIGSAIGIGTSNAGLTLEEQMMDAGYSALTGTAAGVKVVSAAAQVGLSMASEFYKASIAADICKGNFNNGGTNCAHGKQAFYGGRMSIRREIAERIDGYFDAYGYRINNHFIPGRRIRPHWTYIKTIGCVIYGSLPEDDRKLIGQIHDKGIRYWTSGADVGNYALDNRPV